MSSTRRRATIALVTLVALAALAGCSNEASLTAPTGTTPPLDKVDFLTRANKICSEADARISELTNTGGPINNGGGQAAQELKQLVGSITPIAQNAIDHLKSLTPPVEDGAKVAQGIGQMQAALNAAQADPTQRINPIGLPGQELHAYGLSSCFTRP